MSWIKVTPDTMPPDTSPVLVTVEAKYGRYIKPVARYCGTWEWLADATGDYWEEIRSPVTHWMPYPEPADD